MLGNEEDFSAALGYEVPGLDGHHSQLEVDAFKQMISKVVKDYPFQVVATTLRKARTATDRKSTRLNSSHVAISYAVFCLKKKKKIILQTDGCGCLLVHG